MGFDACQAAFDVVAEPARRRLLDLLLAAPRAVGELAAATGMSQPNTSRHLRVLREAGLVESRSGRPGAGSTRSGRRASPSWRGWLTPYALLWQRAARGPADPTHRARRARPVRRRPGRRAPIRRRGRRSGWPGRACPAISWSIRSSIVPGAHHPVHLHDPRLADPVGAVGRLILDRRIPPAVEVEDVAGVGQVEPEAAGAQRHDQDPRLAARLLELVDDPLTRHAGRRAVEVQELPGKLVLRGARPAACPSRRTG